MAGFVTNGAGEEGPTYLVQSVCFAPFSERKVLISQLPDDQNQSTPISPFPCPTSLHPPPPSHSCDINRSRDEPPLARPTSKCLLFLPASTRVHLRPLPLNISIGLYISLIPSPPVDSPVPRHHLWPTLALHIMT